MSLSPKDDPRTWLIPGPREIAVPPFHARILYYDLTKSERALCSAFDELCSKGSRLCASLKTYAVLSRLSERHVYNLINGRDRNGRRIPGFLDRGILTVDTPAKPPHGGHRYATPAIYVFHEAAIQLDPKALARQDARRQQPTLPGIPRPPIPGEPLDTQNQVHRDPEPVANDIQNRVPTTSGTSCRRHPEPVAEDSKAVNSKPLIQEREIQPQPLALSLGDQEGEIENEWVWSQRRGHCGH